MYKTRPLLLMVRCDPLSAAHSVRAVDCSAPFDRPNPFLLLAPHTVGPRGSPACLPVLTFEPSEWTCWLGAGALSARQATSSSLDRVTGRMTTECCRTCTKASLALGGDPLTRPAPSHHASQDTTVQSRLHVSPPTPPPTSLDYNTSRRLAHMAQPRDKQSL